MLQSESIFIPICSKSKELKYIFDKKKINTQKQLYLQYVFYYYICSEPGAAKRIFVGISKKNFRLFLSTLSRLSGCICLYPQKQCR